MNRPRVILLAGWVIFLLGAFPGYLSIDSILRLYGARSGVYTDDAPAMTALWAALEYVWAGPLPMLIVQSGLLLFGAFGVLRTIVTPRAAAVIAVVVLVTPPVFAPMAVIWPDSLAAGALLASFACALSPRRSSHVVAIGLAILALACRPAFVAAAVPLAVCAMPALAAWRRAVVAVGLVVGIALCARGASYLLTDNQTYAWEQRVQLTDVVGTLRRAKVAEHVARRQLVGLAVVGPETLRAQLEAAPDALDWWPLAHGDKRVVDPIGSDAEAVALGRAWHRTIAAHPRAYFTHRWTVARGVLGISGKFVPVFDSFGDADLLGELHHRARASDWQRGMRAVVRGAARTPLFRPWLYVLLALVLLVLARKHLTLFALAMSALVDTIAMALFAPAAEYRYAHWLVALVWIAGLAMLVRSCGSRSGSRSKRPAYTPETSTSSTSTAGT